MNRKRIWGWWFFDWASQPYSTLLNTFIFPIYFAEVAKRHFIAMGESSSIAGAHAQSMWGYGLSITGIIIALLAPVLGAIADSTGRRMVWIWLFSLFYVVGSLGLWFLTPVMSDLTMAVMFFGIGLIGVEFATIFTNALLPDLGTREEIGRISGSGYAFGYLGGLVALALMLALFAETPSGRTLAGIPPLFGLDPEMREGTRFVGPLTAIWYVLFMIPFFLWVRETPRKGTGNGVRGAARDLVRLLASLRNRPSLAAWLLSSMFSRDALNALYAFGGIYAATVLGWPVMLAGIFGIVSAISATVVSWLGGLADRRWGPKPVIVICTMVLILVCMTVVGMTRDSIFGIPIAPGSRLPDVLFFMCGVAIGGMGGALQAASRTMMVRHTTPERATEAFGLYALSGKATAFLAPFLVAVMTDITQNQRIGVTPLIVMFLLALALLRWVKSEGETEQ